MLEMISDLITSKKFTTSQLGIASVILSAVYLPSDCHTKLAAIGAIALITASAVLAQGLADHGSVAALIKEPETPGTKAPDIK